MSLPPPPESQPSERGHRHREEILAVLLALLTLGGIFAWAVYQRNGLNFADWQRSFTESSPLPAVPTPSLVASPKPPEIAPPPSPLKLLPVPSAPPPLQVPPPPPKPARIQPLPNASATPAAKPPQASTPAPGLTAVATPFKDVSANYWAAPYIVKLAEKKIFTGFQDGTFRPDAPISRAEFAVLLDQAMNLTPVRDRRVFRDVPRRYWAAEAIQTAYAAGFMNGYPGQRFQPKQSLTRVEAIMAIATGLRLQPPPNPSPLLRRYLDAEQIPPFARSKVAALIKANLLNPNPGANQLRPNQLMSRADTAALLYATLQRTGSTLAPTERQAQPSN